MTRLDGKVVLVTGGTGSLGKGVVATLVVAGATVVSTSHRPVEGPPEVEVEVVDVRDEAAIGPLIARVSERHGRIDGLVCLVGGFAGGAFIQTDRATWSEMLDLNLQSGVTMIRAVLPGMQERSFGRIVTVGARPAVDPAPNVSAYAAAKAAVVTLTRSLGRELRGSGVAINCILPSTIDTPQNREMLPKANPDRWVKPEQIGRVVAFLCSDDAGIINGAPIPVYGDA